MRWLYVPPLQGISPHKHTHMSCTCQCSGQDLNARLQQRACIPQQLNTLSRPCCSLAHSAPAPSFITTPPTHVLLLLTSLAPPVVSIRMASNLSLRLSSLLRMRIRSPRTRQQRWQQQGRQAGAQCTAFGQQGFREGARSTDMLVRIQIGRTHCNAGPEFSKGLRQGCLHQRWSMQCMAKRA